MRNNIMTASEAMTTDYWRKSFEDWIEDEGDWGTADYVDWVWVRDLHGDGIGGNVVDWYGMKTKDSFITYYNNKPNDILAKQKLPGFDDYETPLYEGGLMI